MPFSTGQEMSPALSPEPGQRSPIQPAGVRELGRQPVGPELGLSHNGTLGISGPGLAGAGSFQGDGGRSFRMHLVVISGLVQ